MTEGTAYDAALGDYTVTSSPLISRLHPDSEVARQVGFALFVLTYLDSAGLRVWPLTTNNDLGALRALVEHVAATNPHLLRFFADAEHAKALGKVDQGAARELMGWARAQRVEREEPQVAYELGMLALGVELPGILVGSLRELEMSDQTTVVELPDGSGYPTVFLSTLHPAWPAAWRTRLFVESVDAQQLAGWAMLLLAKSLRPPRGSIVAVSSTTQSPLSRARCDVALVYHPVAWLDGAAAVRNPLASDAAEASAAAGTRHKASLSDGADASSERSDAIGGVRARQVIVL